MPMTADNVRALKTTETEECFVCDKEIKKGSIAVGISFKIILPLGIPLPVIKYLHVPACGDFLSDVLKTKLEQAKRAL